MEEIKDTQRVHSQMLQTLLRKDKGSQPEPPEGVEFPLKNQGDVQLLEAKLADADVMSAVASSFFLSKKKTVTQEETCQLYYILHYN